jgi:hypothetical protein
MGQGTRFSSLCAHPLLVANAIHAVAPDAENLVSLRGLLVICPFLGDPNDFPVEDQEFDEACGLIQGVTKSTRRVLLEPIPLSRSASAKLSSRGIGSGAVPLDWHHEMISQFDDLISSLCRLNC